MLLLKVEIKLFSKINVIIFIIIILSFKVNCIPNLLQVYGESPIGLHIYGMEVKNYTLDDAVQIAKIETSDILSAMIYGYKFFYKVENKNLNIKEFLELTPIAKIDPNDKKIELTEYIILDNVIRFQITYKLDVKEQDYIKNFLSNSKFSVGKTNLKKENPYDLLIKNYEKTIQKDRREEYINRVYEYLKGKIKVDNNFQTNNLEGNSSNNLEDNNSKKNKDKIDEIIFTSLDYRKIAYENSIKNAILVGAKQKTDYRPFIITGKLLLKESPTFYINSGKWESVVKVNIIIDKITYLSE